MGGSSAAASPVLSSKSSVYPMRVSSSALSYLISSAPDTCPVIKRCFLRTISSIVCNLDISRSLGGGTFMGRFSGVGLASLEGDAARDRLIRTSSRSLARGAAGGVGLSKGNAGAGAGSSKTFWPQPSCLQLSAVASESLSEAAVPESLSQAADSERPPSE